MRKVWPVLVEGRVRIKQFHLPQLHHDAGHKIFSFRHKIDPGTVWIATGITAVVRSGPDDLQSHQMPHHRIGRKLPHMIDRVAVKGLVVRRVVDDGITAAEQVRNDACTVIAQRRRPDMVGETDAEACGPVGCYQQ